MSSTIFSPVRLREFTPAGAPLSGAKLYFYLSGTTTPAATYSDSDLTHPHAHPVTADTGGLFPSIFLDDSISYDVTLKDSSGATQYSVTEISLAAEAQLYLYSTQTAEPYANTFVGFLEPDGTAKGFVGFVGTLDNRFVLNTREDVRIRFLTGTPGDPTTSIERGHFYGDATAGWLGIQSNGATGGASIRFTSQDTLTVRGTLGFASTADSDFDVTNAVSGGNIDFSTAGTGRIRLPLASGTAAAPMLAIVGDTDTGVYSSGANVLNFSTGGTLRLMIANGAISAAVPVNLADGTLGAPSLSFTSNSDTGLFNSGSGVIGVTCDGTLAGSFYPNGTFMAPTAGSAPGTPAAGQIYYDTGTNKLRVRAGGAWVDLH